VEAKGKVVKPDADDSREDIIVTSKPSPDRMEPEKAGAVGPGATTATESVIDGPEPEASASFSPRFQKQPAKASRQPAVTSSLPSLQANLPPINKPKFELQGMANFDMDVGLGLDMGEENIPPRPTYNSYRGAPNPQPTSDFIPMSHNPSQKSLQVDKRRDIQVIDDLIADLEEIGN
jgi:hypothetical protein